MAGTAYSAISSSDSMICPSQSTEDQKWMQEVIDAIPLEVPMGRFASPEEQAAAIAFLASDDASYVTGQGLLVTGGEPNF